VAAAHAMLYILETTADNQFDNIITGDESWVNLRNDEDFIWGEEGEERPLRARTDFHPKRVMISVFWSTEGFHLVQPLPERGRVNADYFQQEILTPLHAMLQEKMTAHPVWMHYDNAPAHTARTTITKLAEFGFHKMPHPPYSPDIAPSDFYLFGYLKQLLKGFSAETATDLVHQVKQCLQMISAEERADAMQNWIKRLYKLIEVNGEYVSRFF
jgi:histone-lysine N-methyltransferase SETMAR